MRYCKLVICVSLLFCSLVFADQQIPGTVTSITEEDGVPDTYPWQIKFPNTSLTDNGDGTTSVDFIGGSLPTTYLKLDCSNDPLTAALDLPELYNSLGNLKIMPDVQGNVDCFSDTDVDNAADGKIFSVTRRAAEGDTTLSLYGGDDKTMEIRSNQDMHLGLSVAGEIQIGTVVTSTVRLLGNINTIGLRNMGTTDENLPLRHYGYITAGGASGQKYVQWLVDDTDDWFHLTRQSASINGFKIEMPVEASDSLYVGSVLNAGADDDSADIYIHDAGGLWIYEDSDDFVAGVVCKDGAAEWQFQDDVNIGATADAENLYVHNGGTIQALSAGDDKNIQISHNDTNGLITSSDGTISFDNENLTTTGTVSGGSFTISTPAFISGAKFSKSFIITNPTDAADSPLWRVPVAATITAVHLLCKTQIIVGQLWEYDANGLNGATVDADITGVVDTNVDDDGALSNPSIDAGDYLGWVTASATAGATKAIVTFEGYYQ